MPTHEGHMPEGMTIVQSQFDSKTTMDRMAAAVTADGITVFARIDLAAGAPKSGVALGPTEVLIFGNPKFGTPLMHAEQTVGIDLPMKALVWQDAAGKTWLGYNNPSWVAARHGIGGDQEKTIQAMTAGIAAQAKAATTSVAATPAAAQNLPPVPTTKILAISRARAMQASQEQFAAVLQREVRETVRAYLNGKIDQWYFQTDGKGVVFVVNATTVEEARVILEQFPLGKAGLMEFDYFPLGPLSPLRLLANTPVPYQPSRPEHLCHFRSIELKIVYPDLSLSFPQNFARISAERSKSPQS